MGLCEKKLSAKEKKLSRERAYYAANRDKNLKRNRKYYSENKEYFLEYSKKYRAIHRDKINARVRLRNAKKPKKPKKQKEDQDIARARRNIYFKAYRDARKDKYKAYREAQKSVRRARGAARESNKLKARPKWADNFLINDMYQEATYQQLQVDHIVPLNSKLVCGLHWEGNLQLLSPLENQSKGNYWWPDK